MATTTTEAVYSPPRDLDAYTAYQVRDRLAGMASAPRLIIDLTNVAFVDSAGLRTLVAAVRHVHDLGGSVAIACPRGALKGVLLSAGLDRIVTVADSVAAADRATRQVARGNTFDAADYMFAFD